MPNESDNHAVPEITAAQAEDVNKRVAWFNNKISRVYQSKYVELDHDQEPTAPFQEDTDWTSPDAPCGESAR